MNASINVEAEMPWLGEQMAFWANIGFQRESSLDPFAAETWEQRRQYRLMMREPTVKAAFLGKVGSVASQPLTCIPPPGEENNPAAKEIADFVQANLLGPSGSAYELIWPMCSGALVEGFSVCEKLFRYEERGKWRTKWRLEQIKSKDTRYIQLEVDRYRNVVGLYNGRGGQAATPYDPRDFVVMTYLPFFANPHGQSDFRASSRAVVLIEAAVQARTLMLSKYTGPFLVGTLTDMRFRKRFEADLKQARANGYIVLEQGMMAEVMDLAGRGTAEFQSAIDDLRKEIAIGLQGAFLQMLTDGGGGQMRGNSDVQKDTSEIFAWLLSIIAIATVNKQLVPDLVYPNYGEDAPLPIARLGAVNPNDVLADLKIDELLTNMGVDLSISDIYTRATRKPPRDASDRLPGRSAPSTSPGVSLPSAFAEERPADTITAPVADGTDEKKKGDGTNPPADDLTPVQTVKLAPDKTAKSGDVALGGKSGVTAKNLLDTAQEHGTEFLHDLVRTALNRLRTNDAALAAPSLFTQTELNDYADSLAESIAVGDLLGRARIRQRMDALTGNQVAAFAEAVIQPYEFSATIQPLQPQAAIDIFTSLVPTLAVDPALFIPEIRRRAFSLAVSSEQALTESVKEIIRSNITNGTGLRAGSIAIEETLAAAGVTPTNPQYCEMVYRTNTMQAYNRGAFEEMNDPVVSDFFPCWVYMGIDDGRERQRHRIHFDRYYPNTITFEEVRDSALGKFDGFNCRCTFRPVSRVEWAQAQRNGATIETSPIPAGAVVISG